HRRKAHRAALGDQIVRRLGEEERLLAPVAAHLLLVLHIVAADTEDAAHGKACVRSHDGKRWDIPAADHILHFHGERSSLDRRRSSARTERRPRKGPYFRTKGPSGRLRRRKIRTPEGPRW